MSNDIIKIAKECAIRNIKFIVIRNQSRMMRCYYNGGKDRQLFSINNSNTAVCFITIGRYHNNSNSISIVCHVPKSLKSKINEDEWANTISTLIGGRIHGGIQGVRDVFIEIEQQLLIKKIDEATEFANTYALHKIYGRLESNDIMI
jgi:hypothetical protein